MKATGDWILNHCIPKINDVLNVLMNIFSKSTQFKQIQLALKFSMRI